MRVYPDMGHRSTCERVRYWAALAPDDGALSQLEQRLLERHLAQCAGCSAFASDVAEAARALRSAPLEQPPFRVQIATRARYGVARLSGVTAAAGIAAAFIVATVVVSRGETGAPAQIDRPAIVIDATSVERTTDQRAFLRDLRDYRNAQYALESNLASDRRLGSDAT